MTATREFDLILFGATGFTGRLVAEYLARSPDKPRWAIAGRSRAKLEALGIDAPMLVADAHDRQALDALARRSTVMCTTIGPYAKYGSELVAACTEAGTHYCDLTGEVQWMRRMIDRHHARARDGRPHRAHLRLRLDPERSRHVGAPAGVHRAVRPPGTAGDRALRRDERRPVRRHDRER